MSGDELLERVRVCRAGGGADPGLLRELAAHADPGLVGEAGRRLADVPARDVLGAEPRGLRVAVAGSFTCDDVVPLLRVALLAMGIDPVLHLCRSAEVDLELADARSELAAFAPDVTLVLREAADLLPADWDPADLAGLRDRALDRAHDLVASAAAFADRSGSAVLVHTVPLPALELRTVITYRGAASLGRIWREVNTVLLDAGVDVDGLYALDLEAQLVDAAGPVRHEGRHRFGRYGWAPYVERAYAREAATFCSAVLGMGRKLLALDLDGTLWGGVLGDDGVEGVELGRLYPGNCYADTQRRARSLRRQGVLLAVASKNDRAVVDDAFARHPEMVLRPDDFVAVLADWQPKGANLVGLAAELNLATSSFVLADDSPAECSLVRRLHPEIAVEELHGDPAEHALRLLESGHFTQLAPTSTDAGRTRLYRDRGRRSRLAQRLPEREDYLRDLEIRVRCGPTGTFEVPRLAQLARRTNQFTTTGVPHDESRTRWMAESDDHLVLAVEVWDRVGSEGVVAGAWIQRRPAVWLLENLVMSCRVMARGVEHTLVQQIVEHAVAAGASTLRADFVATGRNGPAAGLYPGLGFVPVSVDGTRTVYELDLAHAAGLPSSTPDWITLDTLEQSR